MKCPLCKGSMIKSKTTLPYEFNDDHLVVVQDVPALVCDQCGEPFIEIDVIREVEKILKIVDQGGMTLGFIKYKKAA